MDYLPCLLPAALLVKLLSNYIEFTSQTYHEYEQYWNEQEELEKQRQKAFQEQQSKKRKVRTSVFKTFLRTMTGLHHHNIDATSQSLSRQPSDSIIHEGDESSDNSPSKNNAHAHPSQPSSSASRMLHSIALSVSSHTHDLGRAMSSKLSSIQHSIAEKAYTALKWRHRNSIMLQSGSQIPVHTHQAHRGSVFVQQYHSYAAAMEHDTAEEAADDAADDEYENSTAGVFQRMKVLRTQHAIAQHYVDQIADLVQNIVNLFEWKDIAATRKAIQYLVVLLLITACKSHT